RLLGWRLGLGAPIPFGDRAPAVSPHGVCAGQRPAADAGRAGRAGRSPGAASWRAHQLRLCLLGLAQSAPGARERLLVRPSPLAARHALLLPDAGTRRGRLATVGVWRVRAPGVPA